MRNRHLFLALIFASATSLCAGAALAQGSGGGGGGGGPTTKKEVAACIQKGLDGKPVRKLSSEDVCPMFQFWREDCARDAQLNLSHPMVAAHCGTALVDPDADIATGSLAPRR